MNENITISDTINSKKENRLKKWALNFLAFFIGLGFILLVLGLFEIYAQNQLKKTGEALPKLCLYRLNKQKDPINKQKNPNEMPINDPILGPRYDINTAFPNLVENCLPYIIADKFKIFIRKSDLSKFPKHSRMVEVEMTHDLVTKLERPIIVCLGGSTTLAFLACHLPSGDWVAGGSWSEELSRIMESKKICGTVFCGGTSTYKTSHDLVKLYRDVLEIKPDIVISYGGYNDFITVTNDYNMYGVYQFLTIQKNKDLDACFILPNTFRYINKSYLDHQKENIRENYLGIKSRISLHEYLIRNWKIMNEICKLQDITFYGVLQPCVGSTLVTRNNDTILTKETRYHYLLENVNKYWSLEQLFSCYDLVRPNLQQYEYMYDFSGIFDEQSPETIYIYGSNNHIKDCCHVNQKGNQIVAENMFQILFGDKIKNE
jgi:hypothetical protein